MSNPKSLWTVVEVWRGFAERARTFAARADAERVYSRLRRRCNFEEDDVQLFRTRVHKARRRPR